MDDDYISPDRNHSALLIIDVQRDFTLMGATSEVPGTLFRICSAWFRAIEVYVFL